MGGAQPVESQAVSTAAARAGAQLAPVFVPMLNCGSSPSNRRGARERIEWASYSTTLPWAARSRWSSARKAAW